jgi:hypothetical protein
MATKQGGDLFSNMAIISVSESAANTLTFKKLETGISLTEKVAWVIHRLEWLIPTPHNSIFNADADTLYWGLALSNAWTAAALSESTIIDFNSMTRLDYGTAANSIPFVRPIVKDFSGMPGGGLLVPPTPMYAYAQGISLAAAVTVAVRLHYTMKTMAINEYWELVEARRVLTS